MGHKQSIYTKKYWQITYYVYTYICKQLYRYTDCSKTEDYQNQIILKLIVFFVENFFIIFWQLSEINTTPRVNISETTVRMENNFYIIIILFYNSHSVTGNFLANYAVCKAFKLEMRGGDIKYFSLYRLPNKQPD